MRKVTTDKSGKPLFVQVAKDQAGWKFPADHPTATNDKGTTYYTIPVVYHELENDDDTKNLGEIINLYRGLGIEDPLAEINAGLRLAFGDLAKAPYREKGGQKLVAAATTWVATEAPADLFAAWREKMVAAKGKDAEVAAVNKWLLEQYAAR